MRTVALIASFCVLVLVSTTFAQNRNIAPNDFPKPPETKQQPVSDTLHGVTITDPYRWLESTETPEVKAWVESQLGYTKSVLNRLPGRDRVQTRLTELLKIGSIGTPQVGGEWYFYTRREGDQNQPVLYVRKGVNGQDRALVDVNKLAADGTVALDWWKPSHDGRYVAYGTSPGGSEISTLAVIETATGKLLGDKIERTRAASIAWLPDTSGFYYTRYPKPGEVPAGQEMYNRKVFFHKLDSDAAKDPLVAGEKYEPEWWPNVALSEDGRWLAINVSQGWAKSELWVKDTKANAEPVPVAVGKDAIYNGDVYRGTMYITTNEGAPRYRVFAVPAADPKRENWKEIIPETDAVLNGVSVIGGKLFAIYEKNATSQIRVFNLNGKLLGDVQMPTMGSVFGLGGEYDSKEAFFGFNSFTVPPTVYRIDVAKVAPKTTATQWATVKAPIDPSQFEVKQVWYASKDGTKVPMFIVHKKGTALNGANPTLLTGYGGFNVSETPSFSRSMFLWLESGGVFALANLRGGSEFGEEWHRAGMLDKKQNVFDDFIAAAEYLIAEKYTDREHLAISGGSNGGLLVGAVMTQRPELYRAVVCQVPLLDMVRYHGFQIAKLWIPEYGSPDDPEQFKWLHAYSPYHHVKEGTKYPAVIFMTADTDTRVDPMHAKKMAALMQRAQAAELPVLLRIETRAGHGAGKPVGKMIEEYTDMYSFLFWQLGMVK